MNYVDNNGDITAQIDAFIDEETCGSECLNLVRRMAGITDEAYPDFMCAMWGN